MASSASHPDKKKTVYESQTDHLEQGPRLKSEATIDLEKIARAFLLNEKIECAHNTLGELEVFMGSQIYNLTKILENKPDFEQLKFMPEELAHYPLFLKKQAVHKPAGIDFLSAQDYEKKDPNKEHSQLVFAEKLAITLYTENFYKQMNDFLRNEGRSGENDTAQTRPHHFMEGVKRSKYSLIQVVKEIVLASCIAAHGLNKSVNRKEVNDEETLIRHEASQHMKHVHQMRLSDIKNKNVTHQQGFSSSTSMALAKLDLQDIDSQVHIIQPNVAHAVGKPVDKLSANQSEKEVLFVPNTQFRYYDFSEKDKKLNAIPVRSISGINPFSYSSRMMSRRSHLIYMKDELVRHVLFLKKQIVVFSKAKTNKAIKIKLIEEVIGGLNALIFQIDHQQKISDEQLIQFESLVKEKLEKRKEIATSDDKGMRGLTAGVLLDTLARLNKFRIRELLRLKSNMALIKHGDYVYQHYLSKPYTDQKLYPYDIQLAAGSRIIHRPNHGLAHTVRTVVFLSAVLEHVIKFAKNNEIKMSCEKIRSEKMKSVQFAMLFYVSGRESDLGFSDNPQAYIKYRKNSQLHFSQYANAMGMDAKEVALLGDLIEKGVPEQVTDSAEKKWLLSIMRLAHELDLMRCIDLNDYMKGIKKRMNPLVLESREQQAALNDLLKLVSDILFATGDRMIIRFENDHMINSGISYDFDTFYNASTNPANCYEVCYLYLLSAMPEIMKSHLNLLKAEESAKEIKLNPAASTAGVSPAFPANAAITPAVSTIDNKDTEKTVSLLRKK